VLNSACKPAVTANARAELDPPPGERQVLTDRLGNAGAIVLVELLAQTADQAQVLDETKSDRKAKIVFGGERHGGSLGCPPRAEARGDPNCRPAVKRDELNGR
jgi:hypothetical protein